jgi:hypothetical protein
VSGRSEAFDGYDILALDLKRWIQAGVDSSSVDNDRTSSTFSLAAAFLGTCQAQRPSQEINKTQMSIDHHAYF